MSEIQRALPTSRRDLAEVRPYELGVIRIDRMPPPPPEPPIDPTPRVNALLQEAEAVLARAKAQEADVKREREQVLAEARVQGLAEGKAQAAAEAALLQQELQHWLEELPHERFCVAQAPPLAQLCITAVEKILQGQLTLEPERVVAIVRSAIAHVPHSQRLVVQVHPDDIALLQEVTLKEGSLAPEIVLEADPQLQRGGCRVEGRQGVVDASLEGALLRLSGILVEE